MIVVTSRATAGFSVMRQTPMKPWLGALTHSGPRHSTDGVVRCTSPRRRPK